MGFLNGLKALNRVLLSTLLTLVYCFSLSAQTISSEDATREWLGSAYADTIYGVFKERFPEIPLVIDEKDITIFNIDYNRAPRTWKVLKGKILEVLKGHELSTPQKLVEAVRVLFPPKLNRLLQDLEFGNSIQTKGSNYNFRDIKEWILRQPDGSIFPHDFMVEALRISNGRVIEAWSLAWSVLSEDFYQTGTRNYREYRQKFASATGERHLWQGGGGYVILPKRNAEMGEAEIKDSHGKTQTVKSMRYAKMVVSKRGDEFSYFYHRVGVELWTMVLSQHFNSPLIVKLLGRAGALGEFISYVKTAGLWGENEKRLSNDLTAADSGLQFTKLAHGQVKLKKEIYSEYDYLKSNNKKYDKSYQISDNRPPQYYGLDVDPKFWAPVMTTEELRMRFHHATKYDSEIFDPVLMMSNDEFNRIKKGLDLYIQSGATDYELNTYIQDFLDGTRARPKKPDITSDFDLRFKSNELPEYNIHEVDYTNAFKRFEGQLMRVMAVARASALRNKCIGVFTK